MNPAVDEAAPELNAAPLTPSDLPGASPVSIRIVGLGGAGGNVISHLAKTDLRQLPMAVLDTNARLLERLDVPRKRLLGANLTHGLGAGGDPALARSVAEAESGVLRELCQDVDLLFLVVGLGGGTGTGLAPALARLARECGALVLSVATLPFEFECLRRQRQAQSGLLELKAAADGVICLPNQKIFRLVEENTTVFESFQILNNLLAQGIRGLWHMLTHPGLIQVDFADLCAVLRGRHAESAFAVAEAQGENRSREVIEQLLGSPLLEGGPALAEADAVLVNLVGGPDLSMVEVKRTMEELNRRAGNPDLILGACIDEAYQGRISVTLLASRQGSPDPVPEHPIHSRQAAPAEPEIENQLLDRSASPKTGSRFVPPPPELSPEQTKELREQTAQAGGRKGKSPRRWRQVQLPLQIVSKDRFEKSHPTIHQGEDLDVPTYVRRGIPLN